MVAPQVTRRPPGASSNTLVPGRLADVLDHHIHAALRGEPPHLGRNFLRGMIDHFIRAQFRAFASFASTPPSRSPTRPQPSRSESPPSPRRSPPPAPAPSPPAAISPGPSTCATPSTTPVATPRPLPSSSVRGNRHAIHGRHFHKFRAAAVHALAEHRERAAKIIRARQTLFALPARKFPDRAARGRPALRS